MPNFLICGAGKSATSWLHLCLPQHPDVYVPLEKELHYFTHNLDKGSSWYQSFFRYHKGESAIGEISPSYMNYDTATQRIFDFDPTIRLVFILRNPVERAYSEYCMHLHEGKAHLM